ncbi:hypothetical protein AVEN_140900-1 [Araneus ventricosus]|uniref:Uncharacterized protein n=1 Tax=Araneus ventricosus TaxID=182803 RepID=A0A4Y2HWT3_ARAVE|nr:hypothetical protein AVEN_140900-1 [Araneus ventricosus]
MNSGVDRRAPVMLRTPIIVRSSLVQFLKEKILPSSSEHVFLSRWTVFRFYPDAAVGRSSLWIIRIIRATGIFDLDKRDDKKSESRAFSEQVGVAKI